MFSDFIYQLLENSLDIGITEFDFWQMTIAELERAFESKKRVLEREEQKQAKQKAMYDYIHAELVGRSIARCFSKNNKYPAIYEAYPTLFDSKEFEEKRETTEALRFAAELRQFANFHNSKLQEVQNEQ